jgi:predicted dehydrogenase
MATLPRRTFLKTAALAGTAAVASRTYAQGASKDRIQMGVIGCRTRGWQLANTFARSGRYDVVAMADCDKAMWEVATRQTAKTLPKPPRFEQDFRRILEDKSIQAVAVAAPDHWHACMAVMALAAGKHVYLEKPFSYNINDGKAILAAVAKYPKQALIVGTQHRSCAHVREAGEFIRSGGIGKVGMARCWFTTERPVIDKVPDSTPPAGFDFDLWVGPAPMRAYNEPKVHYNWHFIRDLGTGDMGNWGAHWLDSTRQMLQLDVPTAVSAVSGKVTPDEKEWPDTATILYQFPTLHVVWELRQWTTYGIGGKSGGIEVNGDAGSVFLDRGGWSFYPRGKKPAEAEVHKGAPMDEEHVVNFADCIAGTAKPNAPAEEGFRSAVMCHLGNIASVLNRRVEFDPKTMSIKNDPQAEAMQGREYRAPWKLEV